MVKHLIFSAILLTILPIAYATNATSHTTEILFCCRPTNDLYQAYKRGMGEPKRFTYSHEAVQQATTGSALLILADNYPATQTQISTGTLEIARAKQLRLYMEFPSSIPGLAMEKPRPARWERLVTNSPIFGDQLPPLSILDAHSCIFSPVSTSSSLVAIGRVAGFDKAVYGIPTNANPALLKLDNTNWLVGTTGLSHFQRGRFAPINSWTLLWEGIFRDLTNGTVTPKLLWEPVVKPTYSENEKLAANAYKQSVDRLVKWYLESGIMPDKAGEQMARKLLQDNQGTATLASISIGNEGKHGILEGHESSIQPDGTQHFLIPLRADCAAESAMVLALSNSNQYQTSATMVAGNLLNYIYETSGMCGGERGNPKSPAYGLIAWGMGSDAWERANYGDDNARALLATIASASQLNTDRWNDAILRAVLANYRTTSKAGFRGDRIDMPELLANGWRHYFNSNTVNNSPHFEGYLWACYLWAYNSTGYKPLFDRARSGIAATMAQLPKQQWRRNDMLERAHMVLPLAWLARVDKSPEARQWLNTLCHEIINSMEDNGALPERENGGTGHYKAPRSNEEYGTAETPLIHQTGDKATDQLYTTAFAFIGLHEAAAATNDPNLKNASDKLADYLVRIQTQSSNPRYDGVWFRAFDYGKWDYWASSADLGWGAWVIETGWGQTWIAATFALREKNTSLWDISNKVDINKRFPSILQEMELPLE